MRPDILYRYTNRNFALDMSKEKLPLRPDAIKPDYQNDNRLIEPYKGHGVLVQQTSSEFYPNLGSGKDYTGVVGFGYRPDTPIYPGFRVTKNNLSITIELLLFNMDRYSILKQTWGASLITPIQIVYDPGSFKNGINGLGCELETNKYDYHIGSCMFSFDFLPEGVTRIVGQSSNSPSFNSYIKYVIRELKLKTNPQY